MTRQELHHSMIRRAFALLTLGLSIATPAFADDESSSRALAAAERAYQDVDFPATQEQAQRALETGGAAPEQTARLHVLLGVSAAALGDAEDAKQHFVQALAVDPTLRLDRNLSPKLRDPYLEALGYWSALGERLALRAAPSGDAAHLVVRLLDPAALVSKVELRISAIGAREHALFELGPARVARFEVPVQLRERDYEYVLRALDRYGNALVERGSDPDPVLVHNPHPARDSFARDAPGANRSYLLPAGLAVTGLGAVAVGVVFNVRREQAALQWNGPQCENPGFTRQQQCQGVESRVQASERLAVGFYAGGGALLASSVIALLAGRNAPKRAQSSNTLGCGLTGPGVSCVGRF